jgi:hypothetical protein
MNGREIETRRAEWMRSDDVTLKETSKVRLASKLALFLAAEFGLFLVFVSFASSSGANSLAIAMVAGFLLIPAPFLALAWIGTASYSLFAKK